MTMFIKQSRFTLNESLPEKIIVRNVTPEDHATPLYTVILDHGWAERIICDHCYLRDANDIAFAISTLLEIPIESGN